MSNAADAAVILFVLAVGVAGALLVRHLDGAPPGSARAARARKPARESRQWAQWVELRSEVSARGERVASKAERRIADLLDAIGVPYEHEPRLCGFRPDFYVPQWDLVIEYWGMDPPGSPRRRRKVAAYLHAGHKLVNLENEDWWSLEETLLRKLYRWDQGVYHRWRAAGAASSSTPSTAAAQ